MDPIAIGPQLGRHIDVIRRAGLSVLLRGPHGIGKSEYLLAYARARGMRPYVLDLSLMEPADLTGMPYHTQRDGRSVTDFAPPITLPPPDPDGAPSSAPSLLIIEELNRCDRSLRQPCLQLISARHLNSYRLPADCFVVACVNPDHTMTSVSGNSGTSEGEDEYAGGFYEVDPLDPALLSRFVQLDVRPDREAWLEWAAGVRLHVGVRRFLSDQPAAFGKATPRAWEQASRLSREALETGWSLSDLSGLLSRVLSPPAAQALVWSMQADTSLQIVPAARLLDDPLEYADAFSQWKESGRLDLMRATLSDLSTHLHQHGRPQGETLELLRMLLIDYVPPDLAQGVLDAIGDGA